MKQIGILVAVEIGAVLKSDFTLKEQIAVGKFKVYKFEYSGRTIYVIHSGAGQVMAAAATEILISIFKVDTIINFGIAGALREDLGISSASLVGGIVDYQFDTSEIDHVQPARHVDYPSVVIPADEALLNKALSIMPGIKTVSCLSGNKFVGSSEEKKSLAARFNCDIVEMEAAAIELVADMHSVPVLFIKGVSDSVNGGAAEFKTMFDESSESCFKIVTALLKSL